MPAAALAERGAEGNLSTCRAQILPPASRMRAALCRLIFQRAAADRAGLAAGLHRVGPDQHRGAGRAGSSRGNPRRRPAPPARAATASASRRGRTLHARPRWASTAPQDPASGVAGRRARLGAAVTAGGDGSRDRVKGRDAEHQRRLAHRLVGAVDRVSSTLRPSQSATLKMPGRSGAGDLVGRGAWVQSRPLASQTSSPHGQPARARTQPPSIWPDIDRRIEARTCIGGCPCAGSGSRRSACQCDLGHRRAIGGNIGTAAPPPRPPVPSGSWASRTARRRQLDPA